jgi:hypothetical protein
VRARRGASFGPLRICRAPSAMPATIQSWLELRRGDHEVNIYLVESVAGLFVGFPQHFVYVEFLPYLRANPTI